MKDDLENCARWSQPRIEFSGIYLGDKTFLTIISKCEIWKLYVFFYEWKLSMLSSYLFRGKVADKVFFFYFNFFEKLR